MGGRGEGEAELKFSLCSDFFKPYTVNIHASSYTMYATEGILNYNRDSTTLVYHVCGKINFLPNFLPYKFGFIVSHFCFRAVLPFLP